MTIFTVDEVQDYEGWGVLSVHLTREGAEKKLAEINKTSPLEWDIKRHITEWEVHP